MATFNSRRRLCCEIVYGKITRATTTAEKTEKRALEITTSEIHFQVECWGGWGGKKRNIFASNWVKKKQKKRGGKDDKRNNAQVQNLTLKIDFGIFILANGAHSAERNYQKNKTENT